MDKKRMYKANTADIAVAALVIALSLMPLLSFAGSSAGKTALVYDKGKVAASLDLSKDAAINIRNVTIETNKGKVRIKSSDCPRQICTHTGWISSPAQTIVCVPNKILVEIKNKSGKSELDAVSY